MPVLGPLYHMLIPVLGHQQGLVAATEDKSVIVTTTPLTNDTKWRRLIEKKMYPSLYHENRAPAGAGRDDGRPHHEGT